MSERKSQLRVLPPFAIMGCIASRPIDKVEALRRVMEPRFADLLTRCGCAATAWQKLRALTGAAATTL